MKHIKFNSRVDIFLKTFYIYYKIKLKILLVGSIPFEFYRL